MKLSENNTVIVDHRDVESIGNLMLNAKKDPDDSKNYATFCYDHIVYGDEIAHIPYDPTMIMKFPSEINIFNNNMNLIGDSLPVADKLFVIKVATKLANKTGVKSWFTTKNSGVTLDFDNYGRIILVLNKIVYEDEDDEIQHYLHNLIDMIDKNSFVYDHKLYTYLKKCFADHINEKTGPYSNLDEEYVEVVDISIRIPNYYRSGRYEFSISLCFHQLIDDVKKDESSKNEIKQPIDYEKFAENSIIKEFTENMKFD